MDRNDIEITRLNEQIADLKAEIVELSGMLPSSAGDVGRASRPMIAAVKENPGTVTSVAITAGLIGFAVGYVMGSSDGAQPHFRWR